VNQSGIGDRVAASASAAAWRARRSARSSSSALGFDGSLAGNGASTLVSTRLSFAVTTTSTTNVGRNLRIEWTDPDTSDVVAIPFDVVRWSPLTTLTAEDLRGALEQIEEILTDLEVRARPLDAHPAPGR
jgi:hypothetical protein